jgi:hypothetical protein
MIVLPLQHHILIIYLHFIHKNNVYFPQKLYRGAPGTLARNLIEEGGSGRTITLEVKKRVRLEGAELDDHLKKERESKDRNMDIG